MVARNKVYAYFLEGTGESGIAENWASCEKKVKGVLARYRGFKTKKEAEAWLETGAAYERKEKGSAVELEEGIYFDAGTGRGIGVEVRVTNEKREGLLSLVLEAKEITDHGNYLTVSGSTNNFGELLGCKFAIQIARKLKKKKIFGDSGLVIDYWSKGFIKRTGVAERTIALAEEVVKLRRLFERSGGEIKRISGDDNPADLGFH